MPLPDLLAPGLGLRFAPHEGTSDPEVPRARSVIDYTCRRIAIDWLPYPDRAALGVHTPTEQATRGGRTAAGLPRQRERLAGLRCPARVLARHEEARLQPPAGELGPGLAVPGDLA